jgi:hypothetical protein
MRLINAHTLELEEYFENQIPPYAILSHTWEDEEVSLQDWADRDTIAYKKGYKKIAETCERTISQG